MWGPSEPSGMPPDKDTLFRRAAFDHVSRLSEIQSNLSSADLKAGFMVQGERIPLINPQRGIFKPQQMQFLLSIRTVFPKPGGKVWYDDQREIHHQAAHGMKLTSSHRQMAC